MFSAFKYNQNKCLFYIFSITINLLYTLIGEYYAIEMNHMVVIGMVVPLELQDLPFSCSDIPTLFVFYFSYFFFVSKS